MKYLPFPAQCTSGYSGTVVHGHAVLSQQDNSIEFTAAFIPLLPFGSDACLHWITGDSVMASFSGRVYLSTQHMLRIVDIDQPLIDAARAIFAGNTQLPATFLPATPPLQGNTPLATKADIIYLSSKSIKLLAQGDAQENQEIFLSAEVDFLTLYKLGLHVCRRLPLRRGEILLLCDVLPTSDANLIALSAYSARLEQ